jgi:flavin reductase (DIM6/NTAB) family NADH-FMN oxidoreductase RutF
MVVGSFTSVSLEPPLVAFFPGRQSTSWPKIELAGSFCVNVLAEHQEDVCRALTSKSANKFESIRYRPSISGHPIIEGVVARADCKLYAVHEAGDHFIALGEVELLELEQPHRPLLFLKGSYGQFSPFSEGKSGS